MNKFLYALLIIFCPSLVFADGSLSFTPPPGDFSVVFLGNLFGIVDGVLHGTGSQIMGGMFGVFNAAVLALGGIVITYTLVVSTMNTAQEGQMMGQKWSSIWIPVRSVIGLTLLIPKASGYCLMQIFVMWIIVQGVGAADKIWDAALSYLNRGGAIIQAQSDPTKSFFSTGGNQIALGAQAILTGQVCMQGLQKQLETQLQAYKKQLSSNAGPCYGSPSKKMQDFCNSTVPDFTGTVNAVTVQQNSAPDVSGSYTVNMPNFTSGSIYTALNGICGSISWKALSQDSLASIQTLGNMGDADTDGSDSNTAKLARAIAIQQMYSDLTSVAQAMVGNSPSIGTPTNPATKFSNNAVQQFGIPLEYNNLPCQQTGDPKCLLWGSIPGDTGATLLNGTEFPGAIQDYNGIMLPTLTLINQAKDQDAEKKGREFIEDASQQGWIMAGSYFYDLVNLNKEAAAGKTNLVDDESGLDNSKLNFQTLTAPFGSVTNPVCTNGAYSDLCIWLNADVAKVQAVVTLINGTGIAPPSLSGTYNAIGYPGSKNTSLSDSSTVFGYTTNSTVLRLPNQPGQNPVMFAQSIKVSVDSTDFQLPNINFGCGKLKIMFWSTCLGSMLGDVFYNDMIRIVLNAIMVAVNVAVNNLIMVFLTIPLNAMASIFKKGLEMISTPGVNPIVALAQMGAYYINFVINLWLDMLSVSLATLMIPVFGIVVFLVIGMVMPLLLSWLGVMVAIGFTTAYYVPVLPYMIFTFGSIAWLMVVIEAMVAAPIVALGVTHPEGHDAFGKGEQAIMILMNVFLRPAMMIIGYISAIALSYVSVWIINAGFDHAIGFMQGTDSDSMYSGWAGIYAYFFSILIYTTMYITVVSKAFTLIAVLPDKVLRWIGGQPESAGQDASGWGEESKKQVEGAGKDTMAGTQGMYKKFAGGAMDAAKSAQGSGGSEVGGKGGSTPPPPAE